ncbi:MFS transporter [Symbioplanes lichenis]|uniref:MFS transporter n=1 Tax=Symbioplanes lichenis TaxID=1629072 RepID=UPI002738A902|nr:MFS transporter [Actinoplanes lichenis]
MRRSIGALIAMAVGAFCFVAMETLPVGLLPLIAGDFGISLPGAGLLVTGYGLTVALMSVPLAHLTRKVPRRRLMAVLLAVFVVATGASAWAATFELLLGARVAVALSQSVFWAVVGPAAASLFSVEVRGRAAATVFSGSALAPMLGVPAGTWLGQQAGWRSAFFALAGLGLLALVLVVALMPSLPVGEGHAATGTAPSTRRYVLLVVLTVLVVGGIYAAFTYTTPFLTDVAKFPESAVSAVLLLRGVVDLAGVIVGGMLVDRRPHLVLIGSVALTLVSLLGLGVLGPSRVATATLLALSGFALGAMSPALTARVLEVAPGNSDLASAGTSAAFNLGIAGGAALGGLVLGPGGLRATALIGGVLVAAALALTVLDRAYAGRVIAAPGRAS